VNPVDPEEWHRWTPAGTRVCLTPVDVGTPSPRLKGSPIRGIMQGYSDGPNPAPLRYNL